MAAFIGSNMHYAASTSPIVPHQTWRFGVRFYLSTDGSENDSLEILPEEIISITLPTFKDTVSTRNFMNTRRSYNTGRDTTGNITIRFNTHPMFNPLFDVLNMSHFDPNTGSQLVKRVYLDKYRQFDKIEITMLSSDASNSCQKQITLQSVHVMDISADELNYESNGKLTVTLQLHYDLWYWSIIDHSHYAIGNRPGGRFVLGYKSYQ